MGLAKEETRGFWPCPTCRTLHAGIQGLSKTVDKLVTLVEGLASRLELSEKARKTEREQMTEENKRLRQSVCDMTVQINRLTWKSFTSPQTDDKDTPLLSNKKVLLGDSLIRDVDPGKIVSTHVVCKGGGTVKDIHGELEKLPPGLEKVTVVVGGNDCDTKTPTPASHIADKFAELIAHAKTKAKDVTVAGICPRLTSDATQSKIDEVNAELANVCRDCNVSFVDTSRVFKLQDGSVNDGYLQPDGVHLTRVATNKLAKTVGLDIKDQADGVCRNSTRTTTPTAPGSRKTGNDRQWTTVKYRRQHRDGARTDHPTATDVHCFFCGESGHVKDNCRHGRPVKCHKCHRSGHKERFCHLY